MAVASPAWAHGSEPHLSSYGWTWDPWILVPLALAFTGVLVGGVRLCARAGRGRASLLRRLALFQLGLLCLAGALLSPLHAIGEALFTAHMIEHEIVMAVAAPLLVLARPLVFLLFGLPAGLRRPVAHALRAPPVVAVWNVAASSSVATLLHGLVIWLWHMPWLFDTAVTMLPVHRLQHVSFLASAILFWWAMLWRRERGVAAWHLFATMMHTSLLGALMALSPLVLYGAQTRLAPQFGLTALEDQQLAGMLMWVPAGTIYAGAALFLLAEWIRQSGKEPARATAAS